MQIPETKRGQSPFRLVAHSAADNFIGREFGNDLDACIEKQQTIDTKRVHVVFDASDSILTHAVKISTNLNYSLSSRIVLEDSVCGSSSCSW